MKKLSEKLFEMSFGKIFLISLPIFTVMCFVFCLLFDVFAGDVDIVKAIWVYSILGIVFSLIPASMINLAKSSEKVYRFADEIEKMIRNNEDKDEVVKKLFELEKMSFHSSMSDRVRELGKMAEIKYDIKILKN